MSLAPKSWTGPDGPSRAPIDPAEQLREEMTDQDRELVDWLAEQIVIRRLTAAALFLLESVKPLNYVSSQLLVVLSPILGVFVTRVSYARLVNLLEKRSFIEVFLRAIEAREDELLAERRAKKDEARAARRKARGKEI